MSINNVTLMGRMVAEPELKKTGTGKSVTSFTIAVDKYSKQGEDKQADFLDIVAWEKTCEFICRYFHKGDMIAIQGAIQTRSYEDKNGNKRKAVEVVAEKISFCGAKSDRQTEPTEQQRANLDGLKSKAGLDVAVDEISDLDLPF